jgi:hypothetical protein
MVKDNAKPGRTVGGDKNYDTAEFVAGCRRRGCTPHVAQNNTNRRSAIDGRTTRHPAIASARSSESGSRNRIATVGGPRKTRHCGRAAGFVPGNMKARSLARPGPPWMDQVSRPDFSSEWICCDET